MSWKFEKVVDLVSPRRVRSTAQFLECIRENWSDWYSRSCWRPQEKLPWFRGVHDESYKLIPSIYRGKVVIGWDYRPDEAEDMKAEFSRRAFPFLRGNQHHREGELLNLMQHYRFPTRLSDWTEGAVIALYFAIRKSGRAERNAARAMRLDVESIVDQLRE